MASVDISSDLAAVYFAATLQPEPTLDPHPDPQVIDEYRALGDQLAATLLHPRQSAVIRCDIPPKPGQKPKAIATIHDRHLLVVQAHRASNAYGMRLVRYLLVDLRMASREGHRSVSAFCHNRDRHEMPFRWLRSARDYATSDRSEPFAYNPAGEYVYPDGTEAPDDGHSAHELAFAMTTGHLHGSRVIVSLLPMRAIYWRARFGTNPPHDEHFKRLISDDDFRGQTQNSGSVSRFTPVDLDEAATVIRRVEEAHR